MRRFGPEMQLVASGVAVGAGASLLLMEVQRVWADAPLPTIIAAAAALAGFSTGGALSRLGPSLGVVAATLALVVVGQLLAPGRALEHWVVALPLVVGLGAGATLRPFRVVFFRAPLLHSGVAFLTGVVVGQFPPVAGGVFAVVGAGVALAVEPGVRDLAARRPIVAWGPLVALAAWWAFALAALLILRAAHEPAPLYFLRLAAAVAFGLLVRLPRLATAALAVLALVQGVASLSGGLAGGPGASVWVLGFAGGNLLKTFARGETRLLVPLFASLAALPLVRELPRDWQARGASAMAGGSGAMAGRLAELRSGAAAHTSWSWVGASQWWVEGRIRLVEIDGSAAGISGRTSASERLAGTLAGCSARSRGRVRLVGDDFGNAATVLRGFGFAGVDVAAPDRPLARAVADADDVARRTWLAADIRLLRLPSAALLAASGRASAVVELVRVGWRDGRTAWPDARRLARTAGRVDDGGAHVLLLPGLGVEVSALRSALSAFAGLWPVVAVYAPPEGAESLVVVGTERPVAWDDLSLCVRSAPWLRDYTLATALELGSLVIADHHAVADLPVGEAPGAGMPSEVELLPITALFTPEAEGGHVFAGALPEGLAARQATRRASLQVLRASAAGDIRVALERAQSLADDPGGGVAIDPMVEPLLERARGLAARAAAEGEGSAAWVEADSVVEAALLMNPGSAAARCLRGDLAFARRRADEALRWYTQCAERSPTDWRAFQGIGATQRTLGRMMEAEAALRESARLAPDAWAVQLNLGAFLRQIERLEEAERVLRRAVYLASSASDVGRSRAHLALARLYLQTSRAELALAESRRAEIEEPTADSAFWIGAAQYELQAWADAEASVRLALTRNPRLLDAREALGLGLARRGDYRAAAEAFREVLSVDPRRAVSREKLELLKPLLGAEAAEVRAAVPPSP